MLALLALLPSACANTDSGAAPPAASSTGAGLKIVASTTWAGAFAKAAGATDITVIAPATVQHPPDYDPKPSDLVAVASADYILYAEFDGFAAKLKEAAGGDAELVAVNLENTPKAIAAEVTRLAGLFGTPGVASTWLAGFDSEYSKLSAQVRAKLPTPAPAGVSHLFMGYWAELAGVTVIGMFGPEPITPSQLADLTAKKPGLVLANSHLPGNNPDIPGAARVDIVNFPGADLDLLAVFRTNAEHFTTALAG